VHNDGIRRRAFSRGDLTVTLIPPRRRWLARMADQVSAFAWDKYDEAKAAGDVNWPRAGIGACQGDWKSRAVGAHVEGLRPAGRFLGSKTAEGVLGAFRRDGDPPRRPS